MNGDGETVIFLEMGYSRDEFSRVLPAAMRDWSVDGGPDLWWVSNETGDRIASIRIEPLPERAMGSLRLPVLAVSIDLASAPTELASEFVRRFERGFHRGGG